jgi:6-phosphogluconolactonase
VILPFFIGTYTTPEGAQGIYQSTLNLQTGELSEPTLAGETSNPSYLAFHPKFPILATINELKEGAMTTFRYESNQLIPLQAKAIAGQGPCHLSFHPTEPLLFTASYGSGHFSIHTLVFDQVGPEEPFQFSANPENSPPTRAHCIKAHPNLPFVYGTDLGRNHIVLLTNDQPPQFFPLTAGSPRHFVFSQSGKTLFVNSEHACTVTAFRINPVDGHLTELKSHSTIPANAPKNTTAEILLHPSGKTLYVSNRGDNSIATFAINPDETISRLAITPIPAETPRGLAIDPTGAFLIAAGQSNNIVTTLRLDPITGIPKDTNHQVALSKPVHIAFPPNYSR